MHSLQIPLRVEARGDIALRSSFTHFSNRYLGIEVDDALEIAEQTDV